MGAFFATPTGAVAVGVIGMFICIAAIAVGCTVAVQWRKARQTELEAAIKKEMLERGMSADDIVKVLAATATASKAEHEAALKREMLHHGMSADEIVKVMVASASPDGSVAETPV